MGPDTATEEGRRHHLRSLAPGKTEPKSEGCSLDDIGGSFRKRCIGNGELHEGNPSYPLPKTLHCCIKYGVFNEKKISC